MREPRNWQKYWHSYIAHIGQGYFVALLLSSAHLAWAAWALLLLYVAYQVVEWLRFRDVVQGVESTDWPSRDIGDFLLGMWFGTAQSAVLPAIITALVGSR